MGESPNPILDGTGTLPAAQSNLRRVAGDSFFLPAGGADVAENFRERQALGQGYSLHLPPHLLSGAHTGKAHEWEWKGLQGGCLFCSLLLCFSFSFLLSPPLSLISVPLWMGAEELEGGDNRWPEKVACACPLPPLHCDLQMQSDHVQGVRA